MPDSAYIIAKANILTGLPDSPRVEAIGIKGGKIIAVGGEDDVLKALPGAEVLDIPGKMVTPGLVDAHCHFVSLGRTLMMVNLRDLPDIESCRERIRESAKSLKPGQWLLGRGWNHHNWSDGREPDKNDMDDIVPDNPAMMVRACGHAEWLNSRALEVCGITADSQAPSGMKFEKNANGQPTGLLREARSVVEGFIPPPSQEQLKQVALAAQEEALRSGLTGIHTCESLTEWKALAELEKEGLLKIRVHHLIQPRDLDEAKALGLGPGSGSDRLWIGHVKHFADGSLGAGTALLCEPYCDEQDNCGLPFTDPDELKTMVTKAYEYGYNVAIHAIGDLAGQNALDAIAHARSQFSGSHRDRIEHVQLHRPEDLDRYREMDVTASVQPVFVPTDWDVATRRWGDDRCVNAYAWKTIMNKGIRVQFGSDAPVEPITPIYGLQAAVLRQTRDLKPEGGWRPEEKLTLEEAVAGFTRTAAWISGHEDSMGSIKVGNYADFTVFSEDLAQTPPEKWSGIETEMTIIGGEIVYRK